MSELEQLHQQAMLTFIIQVQILSEACKNDHIMSPKQSLLSSKLATRLTRRLLSQKEWLAQSVVVLCQEMQHFLLHFKVLPSP